MNFRHRAASRQVSGSAADDYFDGGDGTDDVRCAGGNDTQLNFETVNCP